MTGGILLAACVLGAAAARSNETTYLVFFNKVPKCGSGSLEAWFDAAVADRLVGKWILRNEGLRQHFDISSEGISNYGFRLMLRKDWQPFASQFNEELAKMKANGELDAILANYR